MCIRDRLDIVRLHPESACRYRLRTVQADVQVFLPGSQHVGRHGAQTGRSERLERFHAAGVGRRQDEIGVPGSMVGVETVSYTHLDVYKRQVDPWVS